MDEYAYHIRKLNAGDQAYCDWCEMSYRRSGKYPRHCPQMVTVNRRKARRRMKAATRKELLAT